MQQSIWRAPQLAHSWEDTQWWTTLRLHSPGLWEGLQNKRKPQRSLEAPSRWPVSSAHLNTLISKASAQSKAYYMITRSRPFLRTAYVSLIWHIFVYSPFVCDKCGKDFYRKNSLHAHQAKCTGEQAFRGDFSSIAPLSCQDRRVHDNSYMGLSSAKDLNLPERSSQCGAH